MKFTSVFQYIISYSNLIKIWLWWSTFTSLFELNRASSVMSSENMIIQERNGSLIGCFSPRTLYLEALAIKNIFLIHGNKWLFCLEAVYRLLNISLIQFSTPFVSVLLQSLNVPILWIFECCSFSWQNVSKSVQCVTQWRCELTPYSQTAHLNYLMVGSFWGHSVSSQWTHKISSHCELAVSFPWVCN